MKIAVQSTTLSSLIALSMSLCAGTAFADTKPITYRGTLGGSEIIAEFSEVPTMVNNNYAGRYYYVKNGVDIPLYLTAREGGFDVLGEEAPCAKKACEKVDLPSGAQEAAIWQLKGSENGNVLEGSWAQAHKASGEGKSYKLHLTRVGEREASVETEASPYDLFSLTDELSYSDQEFSLKATPYEYLKVNDRAVKRDEFKLGKDGLIADFVDPRSKFAYPRIEKVPGGASTDKANLYFATEQGRQTLQALSCLALVYRGFHYDPNNIAPGGGDLGSFDQINAQVNFLNSKLVSWQESGSTFCTGAHPNNYVNNYIMDLETGEKLSMGEIYKGYDGDNAPKDLVDFAKEQKGATDLRKEFADAELDLSETMASSLGTGLKTGKDGKVLITFTLQDLPHFISAFQGVFADVSAESVKPFLQEGFWTKLQ